MARLKANQDSLSDDPEPLANIIRVLVANETEAEIDAERVEAAVRAAFADSFYDSLDVSVAIVDDPTIRGLNRQFLDHDYPTDVLSFALEDKPPRLEGEIIVSLDTAERCAAKAGWEIADELLLYIVHGALHLAGYRDKNAADAGEMRAAELAALTRLGVTPSPRDVRWTAVAGEEDERL